MLIDGEKEKDNLPFTIVRKYTSGKGAAFVEIHLYKTDDPAIASLEPGREKFLGKVGAGARFTIRLDRKVSMLSRVG